MSHLATASTATPTPSDQSLSLVLDVETMTDLDTGRLTLCANSEPHMGNFAEVSPARARGMIADARKRLDQFERFVKEFEARHTLLAMIAERGLKVYEDDLSDLPELERIVGCFAVRSKNGETFIVVPAGQDPVLRTAAVAELINDLDAQAAQA